MKTIQRVFEVDREEINYLRLIIESYDGMSVLRTLEAHSALIELMISPGCEDLISELLDSLRNDEAIRLKEVTEGT